MTWLRVRYEVGEGEVGSQEEAVVSDGEGSGVIHTSISVASEEDFLSFLRTILPASSDAEIRRRCVAIVSAMFNLSISGNDYL